ncbi:hypothetical protein Tco_0703531 [Tanacetum coccineum]|uniref:Uncharacterized protein n=1 Tax=Tanacetum coccineum TaxID=301880 RepID=A0ABQ4Y0W2_9ASTR
MGLWYPKDSGFELTAFSDADHAGCLDTRKSTSGGIQFLGDKLVSGEGGMDVKETKLLCIVFSRGRVRGLLQVVSSNVDEDTTSKRGGGGGLWLQLQQNTVVLRLSVSHSNHMQPRAAFKDKAHPYSVSLHKGTVLGWLEPYAPLQLSTISECDVNSHDVVFNAFNTLWEILHILDRQDLYHLYRVVQDYYEHIPPTGLGLVLLGDLTIIWETPETSDDDFWKNQEDWEIIRWRLNESSGVHTLELEDGTMIHMLAERRYPLSRELMIRMLDHGMEVEDESEIAITLIHLFILWTTKDGDDS